MFKEFQFVFQSFTSRFPLICLQTLKRKEKEYEHDMERLAREKIATQQRLAELKNDVSQWMDVVEIDRVLRQTVQPEEDQASTSTASGRQIWAAYWDLISDTKTLIIRKRCKPQTYQVEGGLV